MTTIKRKYNSGHFLFWTLPIQIIWYYYVKKLGQIMLKSIWFGQIEPSKKNLKHHQRWPNRIRRYCQA